MSEQLLEDAFTAALFKIRQRRNDSAQHIVWFRIRPDMPRDVEVEEIARVTGYHLDYIRRVEREFLDEVADMGRMLHDFVDRVDRVLEFRNLLAEFDVEVERRRVNEDDFSFEFALGALRHFFVDRGVGLVDETTAQELASDLRQLLDAEQAGAFEPVEDYDSISLRCHRLLDLVTPRPLPRR